MKALLASAVLAALVTACGSFVRPPELTATEVANALVCCKGMAEFAFQPLTLPSDVDIRIDETNPVFEIHRGKSYFKAFALPDTAEPYRLVLWSYTVTSLAPNTGQIFFYPFVLFLDEGKNTNGMIQPSDFKYSEAGFAGYVRIEASHVVDSAAARPRYVVIFTSPELLKPGFEYDIPRRTMFIAVPPYLFVPIEYAGTRHTFPGSSVGRLQLWLEPVSAPQ